MKPKKWKNNQKNYKKAYIKTKKFDISGIIKINHKAKDSIFIKKDEKFMNDNK